MIKAGRFGDNRQNFLEKYLVNALLVTEDVMNFFWKIDNKPVEDTLFWEEAQVDLSKLK